ncbi:unnamed protein product, partial [Symbiodinium necroappetens]
PAELLFVELFCGSARLSKAVAEADLNVLAIDKVAKANVGSLHIAPPCGTASGPTQSASGKYAVRGVGRGCVHCELGLDGEWGLADPLAKECDNSHTHEPWSPLLKDGKPHFPTSEEAAYPLELCKAHAFNLWTQLLKKGIKAQALHLHQDALGARDLRQFTAKRVPPLLGEYWFIGDKLQPMVGVYRTPVQAIGAALTLKHPLEFATPLPDLLTRCVVDVLNMGPAALIQLRSQNLAWILERRIALSSKEIQAHAEMHPDMARCLKGKQTCLWEELLLHTGFPDDSLVREAVWRRKAAIAACKPADDPELAESLWQQTLDETEAGWIK